jgi:tetraacyldisaccharide-1-P 4'-kinase
MLNIASYVNGHDEANSLLQTQYNVHKNVPDSESRLRMSIPKKGSFEFAGLFAGIGDARNLYATLIDIGQQLKNRHSAPGSLRIHLTMVRPTDYI